MNKEELTDHQLVQHLKKLRWDDLVKEAGALTPEKLAYVVKEIEDEGGDKAAQTICVLFLGAKTKEQIEEMGKVLDTRYTLRIIHEAIKLEPSQMWKISSLLIGLTHRVFLKVLSEASPKELEIIQHQALREPVQHHLTLFVHEAEQEINLLVDESTELRVEIGIADPKKLTASEIEEFIQDIERIRKQTLSLIERISRSLQIAWNTNRSDLVAKLTHSKETALRFLLRVLGERENGPESLKSSLTSSTRSMASPMIQKDTKTMSLR